MRMGVRDYLDKNQDLNRDDLPRGRAPATGTHPAGAARERHCIRRWSAFRAAVEKVLPLVQAAAALHDPVPLPDAISSLFRFLRRATGAADGVLLVRSYDASRQPGGGVPRLCRQWPAA